MAGASELRMSRQIHSRSGMVVVCNGMPRSASTWAFNVALGLCRATDPDSEVYSGYDENVEQFFASAPATAVHLVVKCHGLDACGRRLARSGAGKTIYTWRDPADAVVSCMNMFGYDFERAFAAVESSLVLCDFLRRAGTALIMGYDEITTAPAEAVARFMEYLGLDRSERIAAGVADENSFERMHERAEQLRQRNGTRLVWVGEFAHDPETLLHPGHLRDGRTGYGREILGPHEIDRCDALLERYVRF